MSSSNDIYRAAASILVLRPAQTNGQYELLLLHKPRKKDSWQLPQGGVEEGESSVEAALRELEEEAGLRDVSVIHESEIHYQYDFPASYRRFRPDNVCGQRITFVSALADSDAKVVVDDNEIDDFVWVSFEQMDEYVSRDEYKELITILYEEALALLPLPHAH